MKRAYLRSMALGLALMSSAVSAAPAVPASATLQALFAQDWERGLRESPMSATYLGDRRYNDRWDDLRLQTLAQQQVEDRQTLARLHAIDRDALSPTDQLNYDLFAHQNQERIEAWRHGGYLRPVDQRGGIQTAHEILEVLPFATVKDYDDWLARLRGLSALIEQTTALMRRGAAEQRMFPKVVMQRVPAQIAAQIVTQAEDSPMYRPFLSFAEGIPAAQQARLTRAARAVISRQVVPAYRQFLTFFEQEYLPACPAAVGLSAQPGGAAYYAYLTRLHTATSLTPEQIHEIGLSEVARIRREMVDVMAQTGFQGDLPAFFEFLRNDPRFFYEDAQDLLQGYRAIAKRIDPELVHLFGHLPRLPYGVRAIPEISAPDTTTAYYFPGAADGSRAGYYYVNLYRPESRPKWEMEVLTVHESVPGHHLQIALQQELGALPEFRKNGLGFTAFVEGWGLYSESLGGELGLYQDPYSRFGKLTYEMWRAVRLVVDTGMHAKGWTRQQAIDYFKANAPKAELDIINEIDRYIVMPGQALAYKIGELEIQKLRREAQQSLGENFDLRAFHDVVLGSGALPLYILRRQVQDWVEQQRTVAAAEGGAR